MTQMDRVRIMYIMDEFSEMGGAEKNLLDIVTRLNPLKYNPVVVCVHSGSLVNVLKNSGIEVIHLNLEKIYDFYALKKAFLLFRLIRRLRVKIIVTYHESSDFFAGIIAKLSGVPVIISSRRDLGYKLKNRHFLIYKLINNLVFTKIIAASDAIKNMLIEKQNASAHRIITIYNGVDTQLNNDKNGRLELKKELGIRAKDSVVGMIAEVRRIKGHRYFIEAAARVLKQMADVKFLVIGAFHPEVAVSEDDPRVLAGKLGITKDVIFAGKSLDIPKVLSIMDVSVLPSLSEGFSNTILESMSAGIPTIATNVGGNKEAIEDGKTGFLFPAQNSEAFADLILQCLKDRPLAQRIGQAARLRVEKLFTTEIMMEELENLFEILLQQKNSYVKTVSIRNKIRKIMKVSLSQFLYYSGFLALLQAKNSQNSIKILAYHKITDSNDKLSMSTSVKNFKQQLQFLNRNYRIISLKAAIAFLSSKKIFRDKMIVITFDDGSKDIFFNAFPIFKELKIPATVFLAVGPIEKRKLLWFNFIAAIIKKSRRNTLNLDEFGMGKYLMNTPEEKQLVVAEVVRKAKQMNLELRERLFESLVNKLSISTEDIESEVENETLTWEEIRQMRNSGIDFGAHTMSHPILSNLDLKEAEMEITESKRTIEEKLGERVDLFAYPNGGRSDFNESTIALLKNNRFLGACTLISGNNNNNTDPFALRRIHLHDGSVSGITGKFSQSLFMALITGVFRAGTANNKKYGKA